MHQTLTCKIVSPEVSELDLSSVLVWTFCLQVFCDETSIDNLSSGVLGWDWNWFLGLGLSLYLRSAPSPVERWSAGSAPSLCWLTKFLFVNTCQLTRNLQKKCQGFKLISTIDSEHCQSLSHHSRRLVSEYLGCSTSIAQINICPWHRPLETDGEEDIFISHHFNFQ